MKIDVINEELSDGRDSLIIEIDGVNVFNVTDGEPEDNSLGRNFNDCYSIVDMMRAAYEAGKSDEAFSVITMTIGEQT